MDKPKNPGGRPKLADHKKLVQRSIRLAPEHWARIDEYKMGWLRDAIAKAKPPKPKPG